MSTYQVEEVSKDCHAHSMGLELELVTLAKEGKLTLPVCQELIAKKADVDTLGHMSSSALLFVARDGKLDLIETLLEAGAAVDYPQDQEHDMTPLYFAATGGHLECVNALIAAGANVNHTTYHTGASVLQRTVVKGHARIVKALIDAKADVNARVRNGDTALSTSLGQAFPQPQLLRYLLEAKASVQPNNKGWPIPQGLAKFRTKMTTTRILMDLGSTLDGLTPLHQAILEIDKNHRIDTSVLRLMLYLDADINAKDLFGTTPLILAQCMQRDDMARQVLTLFGSP